MVLLMAGCVVAVTPNPGSLLVLGAIGIALAFTKINVGLLFLAAALIAAVCVFPTGRLRDACGKLLVVAVAAGPIVLMHHFLHSSWARGYCLISILAGVSVVLAGMRAKVLLLERVSTLRYIAAGALAAAILIVLETMAEGLSLRELLRGVILLPLRHPEVFSIAFAAGQKVVLLCCVLSVCMVTLYWPPERGRYAGWVQALKCVAGLLVIALLVRRNVLISGSRSFGFASMYALLPLALLPKKDRRWGVSEFFPRIFVTSLAAMQLMQAYPVAGGQVNIGAAPFLLWAFLCVSDGAGGLLDLFPGPKHRDIPIAEASMIGALVFAAVVLGMFRRGRLQTRYPFPASSLQGSSILHLPPEAEKEFEGLSEDIQINCKVLLRCRGWEGSISGLECRRPMDSIWDGWMRGIPLSEQQQTLQELESTPSACVLVRPTMLPVWGVPDGGIDVLPLAHYIRHDMPVAFSRWGYEIHVSPDRRAPWIERASAEGR